MKFTRGKKSISEPEHPLNQRRPKPFILSATLYALLKNNSTSNKKLNHQLLEFLPSENWNPKGNYNHFFFLRNKKKC